MRRGPLAATLVPPDAARRSSILSAWRCPCLGRRGDNHSPVEALDRYAAAWVVTACEVDRSAFADAPDSGWLPAVSGACLALRIFDPARALRATLPRDLARSTRPAFDRGDQHCIANDRAIVDPKANAAIRGSRRLRMRLLRMRAQWSGRHGVRHRGAGSARDAAPVQREARWTACVAHDCCVSIDARRGFL
jgi:hypothetical protein